MLSPAPLLVLTVLQARNVLMLTELELNTVYKGGILLENRMPALSAQLGKLAQLQQVAQLKYARRVGMQKPARQVVLHVRKDMNVPTQLLLQR